MNQLSSLETLSECISCSHKPCKRSAPSTLNICDYGIAYYNDGEKIIKKREKVTLRHVAQNLRHELHKVLQLIISEASTFDEEVSVRKIDLDKPASRIIGATVILDNFIEMIAGVYNFNPYEKSTPIKSSAVNLYDIVTKLRDVYSLVRNTRRATTLHFRVDEALKSRRVSHHKHVIEYLVAILIDNAWKYSLNESPVIISVSDGDGENLVDLTFVNSSTFISQKEKLFEKGYQANIESEGFGFGLYWANLLTDHYNNALQRTEHLLEITHSERRTFKESSYFQVFTIKNILVD